MTDSGLNCRNKFKRSCDSAGYTGSVLPSQQRPRPRLGVIYGSKFFMRRTEVRRMRVGQMRREGL